MLESNIQVQEIKKVNYVFFKMSFSIEERTSCVLWYTETENTVTTQRRFVQKFGKKITPPSNKSIKKTLTGQQRSPFIHLEQLYGRPYGMGELSAQFSSIQMLMVIIA